MLPSKYMRYDKIIKGKKISLRQLEVEDCKQYYIDWLNKEETNKFIEPRWQKHTIESNKEYVQKAIDSKDTYIFAIIADGKHIGNVHIGNIHPMYKFASIGCMVGDKNYWGKGIGTEAINLICDFGFNVLNLHKIQAGIYSDNVGSQKACYKSGFVKEAVFRKQRFIHQGDEYCDYLEFGLLKEEFIKL